MAKLNKSRPKMHDFKIRYETKGEALRAVRSVYEHSGDKLRAYECPFCDGWHAGHLNDRKHQR